MSITTRELNTWIMVRHIKYSWATVNLLAVAPRVSNAETVPITKMPTDVIEKAVGAKDLGRANRAPKPVVVASPGNSKAMVDFD